MNKNVHDDFDFDFGFTEKTQEEVDSSKIKADDYKLKLERSMKLVMTFLNNLKKNPEKEYIKWPNRVKKVEEFEKHIAEIVNG